MHHDSGLLWIVLQSLPGQHDNCMHTGQAAVSMHANCDSAYLLVRQLQQEGVAAKYHAGSSSFSLLQTTLYYTGIQHNTLLHCNTHHVQWSRLPCLDTTSSLKHSLFAQLHTQLSTYTLPTNESINEICQHTSPATSTHLLHPYYTCLSTGRLAHTRPCKTAQSVVWCTTLFTEPQKHMSAGNALTQKLCSGRARQPGLAWATAMKVTRP